MKHNILSFLVAFTVTSLIFAAYVLVKPSENSAFASSVMGGALSSLSDNSEHILALRKMRSDVSNDPKRLLDITGGDVLALFDQPELVRRDVPTTVWQYRNESCVLDIYFTSEKASVKRAPVVHYEVRMRESGEHDARMVVACVRSLARANSGYSIVNVNAIYKAD